MDENLTFGISALIVTGIFIAICLTVKGCEQQHEAIYMEQQKTCYDATKNEKCFVRLNGK